MFSTHSFFLSGFAFLWLLDFISSEMILGFGLILVGFILGLVVVIAAEALGVLLILKWLNGKIKQDEAKISSKSQVGGEELDPQQSLHFSFKKQGKKFPIKVENKTSMIYNGSKTFYIYLETSWEKEAWCKALRLAACDQIEQLKWFAKLQEEFHSYLASLNIEYNSFMKPSSGFSVEAIDRAGKSDGASSKVRQFFRKISKKTSKGGLDNKSNWISSSGRDEKKKTEKLRVCQDAVLAASLMKTALTAKHCKSSVEDYGLQSSSTSFCSGSQSRNSVNSDTDPDEKYSVDEGTLCLNLFLSRLFYDSGINIGKIPPYIVGLRALPMEMSEVLAFEVDIDYSGGALLEIETRLEVRELNLPRGTEDQESTQSSNAGDVSSDLLEDFEYLGKQLNLAEATSEDLDPKEDEDSKSSKSTTSSSNSGSRWKSLLNSVAKQVSLVPLTLAIKISSLKGTLRLHIKPPPSDRLWYGFTSMPDVNFDLESTVKEHKITSGRIASFLISRLKTIIRETIVLPNCESICISMMLAEKIDWVPRDVAPFIWVKQTQESGNATRNLSTDEVKVEATATTSSDDPEHKRHKLKVVVSSKELATNPSDSIADPSSSNSPLKTSRSLEELRTPLLLNYIPQETRPLENRRTFSLQVDRYKETSKDIPEFKSLQGNEDLQEKQNHSSEQEDPMQPKKMGKKERMLDFRRKMGEKLEEKKRHIVGKMRGP